MLAIAAGGAWSFSDARGGGKDGQGDGAAGGAGAGAVGGVEAGYQGNLGNQDLGDLVDRVDSRASADQSNLDKVANQDLDDLKVLAIRIRVNDPGNLKVTAHNKVAPDPSSLSLASCNAIRTMMAN